MTAPSDTFRSIQRVQTAIVGSPTLLALPVARASLEFLGTLRVMTDQIPVQGVPHRGCCSHLPLHKGRDAANQGL